MAQFQYIARDKQGKTIKATLEAESKEAAADLVKKMHLKMISIRPAGRGGSLNISIGGKVKTKDLVIFTRQLATLVNAGVPIVRSLRTLQTQAESEMLKKELGQVVRKVEAGTALADALSDHPKTFQPIYVNMVRAGEEGGILDEVLSRLAVQQEKDAAIKGKIKGAMTYPGVVFSITIIASIFLITTIVPKIGDIIKDLSDGQGSLPIYTRALLALSDILLSPPFIVGSVIGIPLFVIAFKKYIKTTKGRMNWHRLLLHLPVVKTLTTKVAVARFARTFSSLMGAGVNIVQAINTTAGSMGNAVIEKELLDCAKAIQGGAQLSKELEGSKHFPPIVSQMLAVGEETGQSDQILNKVAEFYEEEVDTFVGSLSSILEPMMIVVLGSIVGVIAASVFGPISQISTNIQ
jgi:type IV pilus assembly protein PilC